MKDEKVILFLADRIIATESDDAEGYYKVYDVRDDDASRYYAGHILQGTCYYINKDNEDSIDSYIFKSETKQIIYNSVRFLGYISKDAQKPSFRLYNITRFPHVSKKENASKFSIHNKIKPKKEWRIYAELSSAF